MSKLKEYDVCVPITGIIWVTVEAENEDDAIEKAMESDELSRDNIEEWETHEIIVRGNVFYGHTNQAHAECVDESDEDNPQPDASKA